MISPALFCFFLLSFYISFHPRWVPCSEGASNTEMQRKGKRISSKENWKIKWQNSLFSAAYVCVCGTQAWAWERAYFWWYWMMWIIFLLPFNVDKTFSRHSKIHRTWIFYRYFAYRLFVASPFCSFIYLLYMSVSDNISNIKQISPGGFSLFSKYVSYKNMLVVIQFHSTTRESMHTVKAAGSRRIK